MSGEMKGEPPLFPKPIGPSRNVESETTVYRVGLTEWMRLSRFAAQTKYDPASMS